MSILRKVFGLSPKVDYHELIANGARLIDVRTPAEYSTGKPKGSTNIPLDILGEKIDEIKKMNHPIVLCCASGIRSGKASSMLKSKGIEAYNGGGWNKFR